MDKSPSDQPKPKSTKAVKAEARAERLRKQLRQNLRRRKAATRERTADQDEQG